MVLSHFKNSNYIGWYKVKNHRSSTEFSSVQSLSHVQFFETPCTAARQPSLSVTNPWSLVRFMSMESVMPSNHLILSLSSHLQSFPASGSFPMSQFFTSGGHRIWVSASASVLPMNIQDWFPLGLTDWISLQSKGLSQVLSLSFLYSPTLTFIQDYWKKP